MSNPPLAGRPPFAIDDDDVSYANPTSQPKRQVQKPDNPNDRSSAYNTYDNYLDGGAPKDRRESAMSGHGAIGGLMGGNLTDDESDDETPAKAPMSKNQALFEAAVNKGGSGNSLNSKQPSPATSEAAPPPSYQRSDNPAFAAASSGIEKRPLGPNPGPPHGQPSGMPPPGHPQFARGPSPAPPAPIQIAIPHAAPQPQRLQPAFMGQGPPPGPPNSGLQPFPHPGTPGYGPPSQPGTPGFTPSPIQPAFIGPSRTPIQPAFIKWGPDPEKSPKGSSSVMSHDSTMPILRGNTEETLLVKSGRGPGVGRRPGARNDGDDFWRRFSMVVKQEKGSPSEKTSPWLKKHQERGSGFSRWVWVVGILFLAIIIGGSVTIWWFTRDNPDHAIPVAIGGGASQTMTNTNPVKAVPSEQASKATQNDRPLITGTATFGTKPIVDKRALPTPWDNPQDYDSPPLPTPAPEDSQPSLRKRSGKGKHRVQQHGW